TSRAPPAFPLLVAANGAPYSVASGVGRGSRIAAHFDHRLYFSADFRKGVIPVSKATDTTNNLVLGSIKRLCGVDFGLAARGRSRKDGFPTVGAVCDRPHFVNSRKNARSQTAPTIDTANSADFCHGLLGCGPFRRKAGCSHDVYTDIKPYERRSRCFRR